ncbi:putative chitinase [Thalassospira sp. 11-3]|nr:putative chitinase [Thalassospira sp. 11-3]
MIKILQFQKNNGLDPDGVVGPNTLNAFRELYGLSIRQVANLFGQLHHETNGFKQDVESLNYSVERLPVVFKYYRDHPDEAILDGKFSGKQADQQTIANKVYWDKNRSPKFKLGNTQWGDGWKHRGRGAIMVTGKNNHRLLGEYVKDDLVQCPELISNVYYWDSALWYMSANQLWPLADQLTDGSIKQLCKAINAGYHGLDKRRKWTYWYHRILTR